MSLKVGILFDFGTFEPLAPLDRAFQDVESAYRSGWGQGFGFLKAPKTSSLCCVSVQAHGPRHVIGHLMPPILCQASRLHLDPPILVNILTEKKACSIGKFVPLNELSRLEQS